MAESSRKKAKDTVENQPANLEKWADTQDAFVNLIYKKLKNKNKKIDKILTTRAKIAKGELNPNKEQLDMLKT